MAIVSNDFLIIFVPAEEGGFTAYIPELAGAVSEGETIEEAREMVLDAANELLACRREAALAAASNEAIIEHTSLAS